MILLYYVRITTGHADKPVCSILEHGLWAVQRLTAWSLHVGKGALSFNFAATLKKILSPPWN